jgi:hypothetical protein
MDRKEYDRQRYLKNREKRLAQMREWRSKNREADLQKKRDYYKQNKERLSKIKKQYYKENREKILAADKLYKALHKDELREYRRIRNQERYNNDIDFKIKKKLKARLYAAMKNNYISGIAIKNLGCSIEELKKYLESKFQPGMTWNNYGRGGWEVDHIRPLSSFDLTKEDQVKIACHYTNLQPLWREDNLKKSNTL